MPELFLTMFKIWRKKIFPNLREGAELLDKGGRKGVTRQTVSHRQTSATLRSLSPSLHHAQNNKDLFQRKYASQRAGEMAQQFRALAAFAVLGFGLVFSTHMMAHICV